MAKEKKKNISGKEVRRQLEAAKLEVGRSLYRLLAREFSHSKSSHDKTV